MHSHRRHDITDKVWTLLEPHLPGRQGSWGGIAQDNRLFINAIMFVAKCGIPWRDLPERFGSWNTVYVRFRRWAKQGVWQRIFKDIADRDVKTLLIDSTAVRVHQHGAGALKKQGYKQTE